MKNIKLFILVILILTINYSCKKFDKDSPNVDDTENTMKDIVVPDGFKWETISDYTFYITGGSGEVVFITSEDESITYHKGTYIEDNGSYRIDLRLPSFVEEVKINAVSINLAGSSINHDLSTKAILTNQAIVFNGSSSYVDLGDITELNNASYFTIEGWAKQTSTAADETIFSKYFDATNDLTLRTDGGALYIELGNGFDSYAYWPSYGSNISGGAWFHYSVTFDGSLGSNADRLKLFINGSTTPILLSFPVSPSIPATTSASLSGANLYLSTVPDFFTGSMNSVRIWSVAQNGFDNNALFDRVISGSYTNLVASWRMNEGTGTTTADETNGYDGTLINATWEEEEIDTGFDSDEDGVPDLIDDYWDDGSRAYDNYYPDGDTGTVVFEDLWPGTGDYDFNDLVIGYQFKTVTNAANEVREIIAYFEVRAHGAQLNNAFGFQLPGADGDVKSEVVVTGYSHTQGAFINVDGTTYFETGQTFPVVIVMDQISDFMDKWTNTTDRSWKPKVAYVPMTITMTVPLSSSFDAADFDIEHWDPFMIINQNRELEVHLIDRKHTDKANPSYLGTVDDVSDAGNNKYYRTATGLPWALEFLTAFEWPREKVDITWAYYHFREWAESDGGDFTDWYSSTASGYRFDDNIY